MKRLNVTASILSLIYSIVSFFAIYYYYGSVTENAVWWLPSIIPGGVVVIKIIFMYIVKKDYIRDIIERSNRKKESNDVKR